MTLKSLSLIQHKLWTVDKALYFSLKPQFWI